MSNTFLDREENLSELNNSKICPKTLMAMRNITALSLDTTKKARSKELQKHQIEKANSYATLDDLRKWYKSTYASKLDNVQKSEQ